MPTNTKFTIADLGDSGNPNVGATLFGFDVVEVPELHEVAWRFWAWACWAHLSSGRRKTKSR